MEMTKRRRFGRLGIGLAAAGLLLAVAPGGAAQASPASAPGPGGAPATKPGTITTQSALGVSVSGTTNMRACASTSCAIVGTASPGQTLRSWCFVNGQTVSGIPWWDIVYNASTGRAGFITESLLNTTAQSDLC